jgi:hypothetical protein
MTIEQAQNRAALLGLSAWIEEVIQVGHQGSEAVEQKCVGFATAGVVIARAESWDAAFDQAVRIIFHA